MKEPEDEAREASSIGDGKRTTLTAGETFTILWRELADMLGTAAAASLVRRSAQRAETEWPELAALSITRESLEYRYDVPATWNEPAPQLPRALRGLARELWTLLVELTGTVVVRRLAKNRELREQGLVPTLEQP